MTKKVLISLDEIKGLFKACVDIDYAECWADYRDIVNQDFIDDWFDAQPAVIAATFSVNPGREYLEEISWPIDEAYKIEPDGMKNGN